MIRPRRWKHSIAIPVALAMLAIATALGAACGSDGTEPAGPLETPTSEAGGPSVQMTPTPSPAQEVPDSSSPELSDAPDVTQPETPTPPSATEPGQLDLLLTLLQGGTTSGNLGLAFSAVSEIQASGDRTFVPALIDYLRVPVSRQQVQFNAQVVVPALEAMTGESFGYDLKAWGEWLGRQPDITLFEGFARWKAVLYSMLDPSFGDFFLDKETNLPYPKEKVLVDLTQVLWGGVLKDDGSGQSIPALVNPIMVTPEQADYLTDDDRVFGVSINGESRAYPLRIINWHEMANDVVGGRAVALAYCTLCGSGILYDSTVDGTLYTFRTSGLLYKSNKLMYDLNTNTLWNQFTGEPVLGELADSGIKLEVLPITLTTWGEWRSRHPDTKVLDINTGYVRNYASEGEPGAAYNEYFASPDTWFPVPEQDDRLETKAIVYGLEIGGAARAYPVETLKSDPVTNDSLGGINVVLVTDPASGAVRAYERGDLVFQLDSQGSGSELILDNEGQAWRVEESALVNVPNPQMRLKRLGGHAAYWFGWYAFHPETTVYRDEE